MGRRLESRNIDRSVSVGRDAKANNQFLGQSGKIKT